MARETRRAQRLYDRWAVPYRLVDAMTRGVREGAIEELGLDGGETVLDLGCGPGDSLPLLGRAVGPTGTVLGLDYSEGMVSRAGERTAAPAASAVVRGDATALPLPTDGVDGVFASLALSAMADAPTVLSEVRRVLRPGGRLVVVDGRTGDGAFGRLLARVYRRLVNYRNRDVPALLRAAFPTVTIVREFDAGLGFVARAEAE